MRRFYIDEADLKRLSPGQRLALANIRTTLAAPPRTPPAGVMESLDESFGERDD
jgi:hypothetical protein